ncbi:hypothetical protein Vadar_018889 [Vaccinium darrowii]|uniref:Uncharacterized protein n=1 Tax=Vaccinium darrowii TaxID=229202 RepID=A0ACB7YNB1_9ERIC|nr:hypothetical protein Vadar_018889 [Vaccinium darrowii]
MEVPPDTPPKTMVALLTPARAKHVVVFTEKDLPPEGAGHNKPLHITLKCMGKWVPVVLLDNGSALNVCPLRTAYCLGFKNKDFQPSNLGVRAYATRTEIPWLHRSDIMAVPSSLHQKVQLDLASGTLTIHGDSGIRPHVPDNAPLLEIAHGEEDVTLCGFSFDISGSVLTAKMDKDFSVSSTALEMMRKNGILAQPGVRSEQSGDG